MNSDDKMIITIRLIRSFHYRNIKNLVLKDVDPTLTFKQLKETINKELKNSNLPPPFKTYTYDCLKIEHFPFKAKTNDPVINCEDDDLLMLKDEQTLADASIVNETEISYFLLKDYEEYRKNKQVQIS